MPRDELSRLASRHAFVESSAVLFPKTSSTVNWLASWRRRAEELIGGQSEMFVHLDAIADVAHTLECLIVGTERELHPRRLRRFKKPHVRHSESRINFKCDVER